MIALSPLLRDSLACMLCFLVPHDSHTPSSSATGRHLTAVNVTACAYDGMGDKAVSCLSARCRGLKTLHVGYCTTLSDSAFQVLSQSGVALSDLSVAYCERLTNRSLCDLAASPFVALTALDLQNCARITTDGVVEVSCHVVHLSPICGATPLCISSRVCVTRAASVTPSPSWVCSCISSNSPPSAPLPMLHL